MLCRFLPVIHHKDVRSSDVYPQSTVPFRKSSKCLLCHSSTDPLAGGLRNFVYVKSPFDLSQKALNSEPYYTSLSQTHRTDPEDWKPEKTPNFYTSHPHGRLYYRNINNSLKEEKYNSLNELGEILSQQIDLYYCFVSRYKNYLIGESTTISNFNRKDSYFSKASHKMTMKLAQELMVHQDIKKTIKDIISLPEYLPTSNTEKVSQ
ncbi:MAG: hypothetical protein HRT44_03555 [Bdellovibrionales bacterium]|nr:hypothetical protein [Bdellovibrionales bacterium]NQZ18321.1 hypothetical protein [Bdellovibrionales bacterium]